MGQPAAVVSAETLNWEQHFAWTGAGDFLDRAARFLRPLGDDPLREQHAPFSDYDLSGDRPAEPARALRPAAVLAAIAPRPDGLSLVLTRRADHLAKHAGQVAFPGGRVEATDASPAHAALREAQEEIGLDPAKVQLLGYGPLYETVTGFLVAPVVGLIDPSAQFRLDAGEVAELFEVALDSALDPRRHLLHETLWNGRVRRYYSIPTPQHFLWGATAGMIRGLARQLYGGESEAT